MKGRLLVLWCAAGAACVAASCSDGKKTADADADGTVIPDGRDGEGTAELDGGEGDARPVCGNGVAETGEECDDGNRVDGDGCDPDCTFSCRDDADCDDGHPCTGDECDPLQHACHVLILAGGTLCRAAAGGCDTAPEYCDGAAPDCPADVVVASGTLCRAAAGICDVEETCTGTAPACPADAFLAAGTPCRASAGQCDAAEGCTGSMAACPADAPKADGTPCSDGVYCTNPDLCNAAGVCVPGPTVTELHGVKDIWGGQGHTCVRTSIGGLKCWGSNYYGELGTGTTSEDRTTPLDVTGLPSEVSWMDPDDRFTCGVTSAGAAVCWGANWNGQLGDGTTTNRPSPAAVAGLSSGIAAVDTGVAHACALTTPGGMFCWGANSVGQLGDGTTVSPRTTPVAVLGLSSGVRAIGCGWYLTCALTTAGGVLCWGRNDWGQVGDGTTDNRITPVGVLGLSSGVASLVVGADHVCALTSGGGVKCWGRNDYGQVGDGTRTSRPSPVSVTGLASGAVSLVVGGWHACALTGAGGVKCWGENGYGQLGDGSWMIHETPIGAAGLSTGVAAIGGGTHHTCATTSGGVLRCWGHGEKGQLGNGDANDRRTPTPVLCN